MTLESHIQELVGEAVREALSDLKLRLVDGGVTLMAPPSDEPLDSDQLMARGYSKDEAYTLLRATL